MYILRCSKVRGRGYREKDRCRNGLFLRHYTLMREFYTYVGGKGVAVKGHGPKCETLVESED